MVTNRWLQHKEPRQRDGRTANPFRHHGRTGGKGAWAAWDLKCASSRRTGGGGRKVLACLLPCCFAQAAGTETPLAAHDAQFRTQKSNNNLLLVASARGFLADVREEGGWGLVIHSDAGSRRRTIHAVAYMRWYHSLHSHAHRLKQSASSRFSRFRWRR